MPYTKQNRNLTDEQFSEGTTIDGSRIDKAIEDVIDEHNNISPKYTEARWMPVTYVMCWSPSRPFLRYYPNVINGKTRYGVNHQYATQNHWFPFLATHNARSEYFPANETPLEFDNEFRHKGFFYDNVRDAAHEERGRDGTVTTVGGIDTQTDVSLANNKLPRQFDIVAKGQGEAALQERFFAATFPFYFTDPVILSGVSVFAAQEHPVSFFNSGVAGPGPDYYQVTADGYKSNTFTPLQYDYTPYRSPTPDAIETITEELFDPSVVGGSLLPACTGFEYPGELYTWDQQNIGAGTIQVSIDNEFLKEKRELNNVVFNKTMMGDGAHRFNKHHTTAGTAAHPLPLSGGEYVDMVPEYHGGPTWGVWIKEEDLNIPVPRDSRVRFSIINKGFRASQLFEWHIAITVLEQVKE